MSIYRDEEELTMKIIVRRFEVNIKLADANGEVLASSTTHFAKPVSVGGITNFIKKEVYRLADMITEAIYISYGDR